MAKTKSKAKKKTPAVRYLRYELTNSGTPGTETSHYVDLARDLSAINRRLYRQGRDYHVRKITVISSNTPNGDNRISVSTVPDSWTARGAWKRTFELWNEQYKMVNKGKSLRRGTYADFKVHLSNDARTATKAVPLDNGGNALQLGEWDYTTLVTPDGTTSADEFELHMLGPTQGAAGARVSVGMIGSYGQSRATVNQEDPNVPINADADPLLNIFDAGTHHDEVIDLVETENDAPPYDVTNYPGSTGNMAKPLVVQDGTISDGRCVLGGFNAICGLLEFETQSAIASDVFSVLVELAPGNYRGIAAEVI